MNTILRRGLVLFMGIVVSATLAHTLRPTQMVNKFPLGASLASTVPVIFGDWVMQESGMQGIVSPEVEEKLTALYSETLSRTYVNRAGVRIMLSLAYGKNQSRAVQIHKPEVCYAAQGFQLSHMRKAKIQIGYTEVPVMNLVAFQGRRIEPITYWIRSGDDLVSGWYEQNKSRIGSGLKGEIPDGLLVRVSSISADREVAFAQQSAFIGDMVKALPKNAREMFLGDLAQNL